MKNTPDFGSRFRILKGGKISLVVSALLTSATLLHAAPTGGTVTTGTASISQSGSTTTINQTTNKASINWQNFSIAPSETVNFVQPSATSVTLNRVVGTTNSLIEGAMNANGQVILINPNGVVFTEGATVNVGGLVATTKNMTDENFQAGNYLFEGNSDAGILNRGTITAANGGYVAMMGKSVANQGTIQATLGRVELAGGNKFTLNLNGNSLLKLTIDEGALNALVENGGLIKADGGQVYLTTQALNSVLDGMVNNTGVIQAQSMSNQNGEIVLYAHGGTLNAGGTLDTGSGTGHVETSAEVFHSDNTLHVNTGSWLIAPVDLTIDSTLASTIQTSLNGGANVTESATNDITVNSGITWNTAKTLTLSAGNDIHINADITASNATGKVVLEVGQGAGASGNTASYDFGLTSSGFTGKINLQAGQNFDTKLGSDGAVKNWTVITALGNAGDENSNVANSLQSLANSANLSGNFVLGSDINAAGTSTWNETSSGSGVYNGWVPIGAMSDRNTPSTGTFQGSFDGLGHTISGLRSTSTTIDIGVGLFGGTYQATISNLALATPITSLSLANGGGTTPAIGSLIGNSSNSKISNIIVSDATLSVTDANSARAGGLIGRSISDIVDHIYMNNITISSDQYGVGGLIGNASFSTISNSSVSGTVTSTRNGGASAGGLIGYGGAVTVISSTSSANVIATPSGEDVGGLIGYSDSDVRVGPNSSDDYIKTTISSSSATGSVTAGSDHVGGLIGFASYTDISNSHATGAVTSTADQVGGLVGYAEYVSITNSYATGAISGRDDVGGLVGYMTYYTPWGTSSTANLRSTISSSYATGAVSGSGDNIGGLVGYAEYTDVSGSHATGNVTSTGESAQSIGGLVGYANTTTISSSYYSPDPVTDAVPYNVSGNAYVGGLVGFAEHVDISDSHAAGVIYGYMDVGGLVGNAKHLFDSVTDEYLKTTISSSYADATVSGTKYIGGLVGFAQHTDISTSHATGDVTATRNYSGGLVGYIELGTILNSYATGAVSGNTSVGGLVGDAVNVTISDSHATGNASGVEDVGGLVGSAGAATISDSYATGDVEGVEDVGGLVGFTTNAYDITSDGYLRSTISSSYATGVVAGSGDNVGGLVGYAKYTDVVGSYHETGIVTGVNSVGGLIGYFENGTIDTSYATVDVTGRYGIGGLVGDYENSSTITDSYATGDVSGENLVGGLVGVALNSTIEHSNASGTVSGFGNLGGLVGSSQGTSLTSTYATGDVIGTGNRVGGLVGYAAAEGATITLSYATGDVEGADDVGGLVGYIGGYTLDKSYATGNVTGADKIGGLVGEIFYVNIQNSYAATGNVLGTGTVGGLVGYNSYAGGSIDSSYAANTTAGAGTLGGLVGDGGNDITITNSYYDKTVNSGMVDASSYGKTTAEMKALATFSDWDIVLDSSLSNVYPKLRWNTTGLTAGTSVWVMGKASINYSVTGGTQTYGTAFTLPTPTFTGGIPTGTVEVKVFNSSNVDVTAQAIAGTLPAGTYTVKTLLTDNSYTIASSGNTEGILTINPSINASEMVTNIVNNSINNSVNNLIPTTSLLTQSTSGTQNSFERRFVSSLMSVGSDNTLGNTAIGLDSVIRNVDPTVNVAVTDSRVTLVGETGGEGVITRLTMEQILAKSHGSELRVALSPDSFVELVNGGVTLPNGVSQEFYVVKDKL